MPCLLWCQTSGTAFGGAQPSGLGSSLLAKMEPLRWSTRLVRTGTKVYGTRVKGERMGILLGPC